MILATLVLLLCAFIFAPLQLWQGGLLIPLACAIVGSAFGAWRFVCVWVAVFLVLAVTHSFPWVEFLLLLLSMGLTAWIVPRFLHQEQGPIMIVTLAIVFLVTLWLQTALTLHTFYHPSIFGSFLLTFPLVIGLVIWFTYPKRWLI